MTGAAGTLLLGKRTVDLKCKATQDERYPAPLAASGESKN
jgi:hypothetical protein